VQAARELLQTGELRRIRRAALRPTPPSRRSRESCTKQPAPALAASSW
jgi:hypothetical protein